MLQTCTQDIHLIDPSRIVDEFEAKWSDASKLLYYCKLLCP